ncbi:MAG: DUF262 domain-containing protein [Terracidiphilus sp.]
MSTNYVNLDALIPREDFVIEDQPTQTAGTERISITELEGPFFGPSLRKPDFQRETNRWTPAKVVDLIRAFVDGDLIPAVILWKAGRDVFVIDGAHRLGALLAWIFDDYGDNTRSLEYFGKWIPEEQRQAAIRTRTEVEKTIGKYQDYKARLSNQASAPPHMQKRLANLATAHIVGQWVPRTDKKSAEDSFFKINLAATPIDPTESRILKSRLSASAIAARAITNGGRGHKYWTAFDGGIQRSIEEVSGRIYHALYDPPIRSSAITTLDLPVAGHGYNVLAFAFDLVNESNGVDIVDTATKRNAKDKLPEDTVGTQTLSYLETVEKRIQRITTDQSRSLGVHPVVYFYTRGGAFQPSAFLATSRFLEKLDSKNKLKQFVNIRGPLEDFLIAHKEALGLIVHKFGSGGRHIPWLHEYYERIADGLWNGQGADAIWKALGESKEFSFLAAPSESRLRDPHQKKGGRFSDSTKTASFFNAALPSAVRCDLCKGLIHTNSVHTDHKVRRREEGGTDMSNAHPLHPYCDSIRN